MESIAVTGNDTIITGWSNGFIDCLMYCQVDDQIFVEASYLLYENYHSEMHTYTNATFSGYLLFNT